MQQEAGRPQPSWTFLTNHAHVLLCLARDRSVRMRDIAEAVGITERAVQQIIRDLDREGFIKRVREGRCNAYQVHVDKQLRHPLESYCRIGGLIDFVLRA